MDDYRPARPIAYLQSAQLSPPSDVGAERFQDVRDTPAQSEPPFEIPSRPFVWRDPRTFPRRDWIYGRHLVRKFISLHGGARWSSGSPRSKMWRPSLCAPDGRYSAYRSGNRLRGLDDKS